MEYIKLFDGVELTCDSETEFYEDVKDAFNCIHIPEEFRSDLFRKLFAFRYLDLSAAYAGHHVALRLVPTKD